MSELQEYVVQANGMEHTLLLDDADAERLNAKPAKPAKPVKAATPSNKAADAANKSGGR